MQADFEELREAAGRGDFFALLGVPHGYDVDLPVLKRHYLELSRRTHPDFFAGDPEKLPAVLAVSAALNEGLRTLQDPVRRAEYLLLNHGGRTATQDKRVPAEMLSEVLLLREEIDEARAAGDTATLEAMRRQLGEKQAARLEEIAELAGRLPTEPRMAAAEDVRDDLRLALNAIKYIQGLMAQLG